MTSMTDGAEQLLRSLETPLWIVTSQSGQQRGGLVATFVASASIAPGMPRVVAGIARQHATHQLIEESNAFVLHLVAAEQADLVWHFGLNTGRNVDKFDGLATQPTPVNVPRLESAPAWLACKVEAALGTGDRTLFLADVVAGGTERPGPFLTWPSAISLASPEQRVRLKQLLDRDGSVDAAAIAAWRIGRS